MGAVTVGFKTAVRRDLVSSHSTVPISDNNIKQEQAQHFPVSQTGKQ